jgi:hypothetical protein
MDNETLASLLRGRNRAGQPVDATANIIGPAMSALGNTIYGAGRGALTAMAGLPGDINQLITDNLGTLVNAQGLPTTKEIQDFLPAKPTTYEGKLAQKLGEFVPVNPTPIAKGAVAIAKPVGKAMGEQAYRMTEDMLQKQGMMPSIVAYHGTPHNIEGAFDISKVGTGEGAQAYGHGMYYAENPVVATAYKNILSKPEFTKTAEGVELRGQLPRMLEESYSELVAKNGIQQTNYGDVTDIVGQKLDRQMKDALKANDMDWYNKTADMKIDLARFKENPPPNVGNLYKVDIPDEYVPKMLDWDKPINQQSKEIQEIAKQLNPELSSDIPHLIVQGRPKHWTEVVDNVEDLQKPQVIKLLKKLYGENATVMPYGDFLASKLKGEELYKELASPSEWAKQTSVNARKSGIYDAETSAKLNELGIKGIRYLDQGSRGKEKGSSNFVVFDPKEVKILEKNSKPVSRKDIIEEQVNNLK